MVERTFQEDVSSEIILFGHRGLLNVSFWSKLFSHVFTSRQVNDGHKRTA